MIYNDGYELDEFGRAKTCPTCQNEETSSSFCKICGSFLINKCSNVKCGIIAEGNARFCTNCGEQTVFNLEGYLYTWEVAKQNIEEENYSYSEYVNQQHTNNGLEEIDYEDIPF